jgi:hypothetical protein
MTELQGSLMAGGRRKGGGKKGEGQPVRIAPDLAEKLTELHELFGKSKGDIIEPMIRGPIEALHKKHEKQISSMKQTRKNLEENGA